MTSRPRTKTVTERVHGGFGIDTTALHDLARDLRKLEGTTAREFRRGLREVGEVVAVEARSEAGGFSSKIADTIKVRVAGATVEVRAGSPDVPEAVLLELGNVGNRRSGHSRQGTFRHPVFGNTEVWVEQPMHPYLKPAAEKSLPVAERRLGSVVDTALRQAGFGGL